MSNLLDEMRDLLDLLPRGDKILTRITMNARNLLALRGKCEYNVADPEATGNFIHGIPIVVDDTLDNNVIVKWYDDNSNFIIRRDNA